MEDKFRIAERQWDQLQGEGQRAKMERQQIENEKEREIEEMMRVIQGLEMKVIQMEKEKEMEKEKS